MNTIFLQLLADRHGIPAGLVLAADAAGDVPEALVPALTQLAARMPCHYRAAPGAPVALRQAGWLALPASRIWRADTVLHAPPPDIDWIEGEWALAPPARPAGNQAASRALALQLVERVNAD